MKPALRRTSFSRRLVKRGHSSKVVVRRRRTLADGGSVQEPYINHAVIMMTLDSFYTGSNAKEGNQRGAENIMQGVADFDADIRVTDRIVVKATNIQTEGGITFDGGEELEVTSITGLEDDPVLLDVQLLRHTSRKP